MNESNLHIYQRNAVDHIKNNPSAGLFMDMGLGKTVSTLTAINFLMYQDMDISNVLIIAPKRVAETVWTSEIRKWEHVSHLKITLVMGTVSQRKEALSQKSDIHVIGRDNVAWLCGIYGGMELPFDMLVIDESSSFKNPKSQRFKALRKVQPSFKRVVILTGTPAPNGLIDLWSQIYLLDRGERLGKFITQYREIYFKPNQRNGAIVYNYKLRDDSEARIHRKIEDICISMKAEDYLDMPEVILNDIDINFPPVLQKKYDDFERDLVLELAEAGEEISVFNAAALSNKLLQFSNGAVYDEDKDWHVMHSLKLEAAEEIVENASGQPVLIAWTYRHDMYRLMEHLEKYKPRTLDSEKDIEDWNDGKIQVLLMHPASGGHGLNLQYGGNIVVWYGQTWSLELYQQLNARLNRQGQRKKAFVLNRLIARKTLDEDVIASLGRKDSKQEGLMQAVKYRMDKYVQDHRKQKSTTL